VVRISAVSTRDEFRRRWGRDRLERRRENNLFEYLGVETRRDDSFWDKRRCDNKFTNKTPYLLNVGLEPRIAG